MAFFMVIFESQQGSISHSNNLNVITHENGNHFENIRVAMSFYE